jgi:hypothetical protein
MVGDSLVRAVSCGLLFLAAACSAERPVVEPPVTSLEEPGVVLADVQAETAAPGAAIEVVFRNTVDREFWFNPCERVVQRLDGDTWVSLPEELRMCNAMAYILLPNGARTETADVPLYAEAGTYRFVFVMRPPADTEVATRATSTPFRVP